MPCDHHIHGSSAARIDVGRTIANRDGGGELIVAQMVVWWSGAKVANRILLERPGYAIKVDQRSSGTALRERHVIVDGDTARKGDGGPIAVIAQFRLRIPRGYALGPTRVVNDFLRLPGLSVVGRIGDVVSQIKRPGTACILVFVRIRESDVRETLVSTRCDRQVDFRARADRT